MAEAPQISAFRRLINDQVNEFISASTPLGEPLTALAHMVKQAFELQLTFIITGLSGPEPNKAVFANLTNPLSVLIAEIQDFRNRNRHVEEAFNHLSTVSESIPVLGWISVKPAPVQFIRDMKDIGEYFGNRVLSLNKGNQLHQTWINKWTEILRGLEQYVKEYHLTGFSWGALARPGASAGIVAPPPPPPAENFATPVVYPTGEAMEGGDDRHALMNEINQGVGITRRLRPVRRDPAQSQQSSALTAAVSSQSSQSRAERTYPPKFFLEGRKWRVEHHKDQPLLTIDNDDMSQSLAMFKCQNSGLEVRNKMNGVSIDNCKKCIISLNDIISSVELIRCEGVKLQCVGHVPLISLDNCDSIQVFLTDRSINAEFISSKSTSLNICLLKPDGDYTELAVPEQIKCVVAGRRLQSTVVEKI
jgi:adenylyl cyclase-associated protein